jgi:hypothetical protein
MTQMLNFPRDTSRGWLDLAHVLAGAPARRRREFAQTEPGFFRSECFAEDLADAPQPVRPAWQTAAPGHRLAALLCAVPISAALLGAVLVLFDHAA